MTEVRQKYWHARFVDEINKGITFFLIPLVILLVFIHKTFSSIITNGNKNVIFYQQM